MIASVPDLCTFFILHQYLTVLNLVSASLQSYHKLTDISSVHVGSDRQSSPHYSVS